MRVVIQRILVLVLILAMVPAIAVGADANETAELGDIVAQYLLLIVTDPDNWWHWTKCAYRHAKQEAEWLTHVDWTAIYGNGDATACATAVSLPPLSPYVATNQEVRDLFNINFAPDSLVDAVNASLEADRLFMHAVSEFDVAHQRLHACENAFDGVNRLARFAEMKQARLDIVPLAADVVTASTTLAAEAGALGLDMQFSVADGEAYRQQLEAQGISAVPASFLNDMNLHGVTDAIISADLIPQWISTPALGQSLSASTQLNINAANHMADALDVHISFHQSSIVKPKDGANLLITSAASPNPAFPIAFTPTADAQGYRLDVSGPTSFSHVLPDYNHGDIVTASLVLPPAATAGTYDVSVQPLNSLNQPQGPPSDSISLQVGVATPVVFNPSGTISGGVVLASSMHIPKFVNVQVTGDLTVLSMGTVMVDGELIGDPGTFPGGKGVDIVLTSLDTMSVTGTIEGGDGADGANTIGILGFGLGGDGGDGGQVSLLAEGKPINVGVDARIASGRGGEGGDATTTGQAGGPGGEGESVESVGGDGGNGGDLAVFSSQDDVSLPSGTTGTLVSNDGGDGGDGIAFGGAGGFGAFGGGYTVTGGRGGDSGNINVNKLDLDDDNIVSLTESPWSQAVPGAPPAVPSAWSARTVLRPRRPSSVAASPLEAPSRRR